MRNAQCEWASREDVALPEAARLVMHGRCPGAYRLSTTMAIELCECECHADKQLEYDEVTLPVKEPQAAEPPQSATQGRKEALGGTRAATRRCEHCGAPTKGRFAPGHDAKLKRDLIAGAQMLPYDWLELVVRGWDSLVPSYRRPPAEVRKQAHQHIGRLKRQGGERALRQWLEARNRTRMEANNARSD